MVQDDPAIWKTVVTSGVLSKNTEKTQSHLYIWKMVLGGQSIRTGPWNADMTKYQEGKIRVSMDNRVL